MLINLRTRFKIKRWFISKICKYLDIHHYIPSSDANLDTYFYCQTCSKKVKQQHFYGYFPNKGSDIFGRK